jgi:NAD(P)-dependent dehydrogenase (short-subunit alcohol dehydrogenase family)
MQDFKGRTAVVTGGKGGLGAAVVHELEERGTRVIVGDHGTLDATDEESVRRFFAGIDGVPDAVVNCIGGYAPGEPLDKLDLAAFDRQISMNLRSAALLTKWALARMLPAKAGHIVHVSSRAAREDGRNAFSYSVAKLGVVRLVEAAAAETRREGITVNCVMPSIFDTPANRKAMPSADFASWPKPAQIAKVIAFLCSEDASLISGAAIPVYGKA